MAELVMDQLVKRFPDGTETVKGVSLSIQHGELFVLVGPSGCGKSTLLNMIVGLEEITEGELRLDGRVINRLDPKDRNMAMVFQSYAIYPHLTVRQNMAFPLKLARLPEHEIHHRIDEAASILELTELLERRPASLSGGQRQRVAMGRAIVREPSVFLLDEPLSNLDAQLRGQMRIEIARLQKRLKATMIYVTHDQVEAMTLGDRVAVLRDGVLEQVGTPRQLYAEPSNLFVAGFVGSPPMNFVPCEVRNGRIRLPMVELPAPIGWQTALAAPRRLIAGIRPEHFAYAAPAADTVPAAGCFVSTVDVVEWLGNDMYVYFRPERLPDAVLPASLAGAGQLPVARLDPGVKLVAGDRIMLRLDVPAMHLFDAESGVRIETR